MTQIKHNRTHTYNYCNRCHKLLSVPSSHYNKFTDEWCNCVNPDGNELKIRPNTNDLPSTVEGTFLNFNGTVNWENYTKALENHINYLEKKLNERIN